MSLLLLFWLAIPIYIILGKRQRFVCLFVCIDRFKSRVATFTHCSKFVSPDALLELGFCSPQLHTSLRLGAPDSWEMSLGDVHRNRTLPLQLGYFSWPSFITTGRGLGPPANHPLNGVKISFVLNFISQNIPKLFWDSRILRARSSK